MKSLTRLAGRRFAHDKAFSADQAREIAALSRAIGRQIGLLIDRRGKVEMLMVGDFGGIFIPELARGRGQGSGGRLRGLRLLHTHLTPELLSQEDLMDLLFLCLDAVCVLTVSPHGEPVQWQYAHLVPPTTQTIQNSEIAEEVETTATIEANSQTSLTTHASPMPKTCDTCEPCDDVDSVDISAPLPTSSTKTRAPQAPPKPYMVHDALPWHMVDVDFPAIAEALEEEWGRHIGDAQKTDTGPRAILISVNVQPRPVQEQHLDELADLAKTAGLTVVGRMIQRVSKIQPKHVLGRGKMTELEVLALQGQASVLIFDGELSPAQLRSLADITERKVLDRTQLILDIFAQHAVTSAGKLQVEMAQLKYIQPRLVGKNKAMDRLMGGIGGRGPGETKLETDRRRIRDRITKIKKDLDALRKQRAFTRARRSRQGIPLVALVGYTNAGKSTLLNTLTQSKVKAENKLFATLDTTTRRLRFPQEHEVILADTVGFIRNLPKELTEAFLATLEELEAADVLLHVSDASHPAFEQQMESVETVLEDMKLHSIPRLVALNKWDLVDKEQQEAFQCAYPDAVPLSAAQGTGMDFLLAALGKHLHFI